MACRISLWMIPALFFSTWVWLSSLPSLVNGLVHPCSHPHGNHNHNRQGTWTTTTTTTTTTTAMAVARQGLQSRKRNYPAQKCHGVVPLTSLQLSPKHEVFDTKEGSLTTSMSTHRCRRRRRSRTSWPLVGLFGIVGGLYWYLMVLGSLAASQGWPGIPDWLPLVPGWPLSDADLEHTVMEDSQHFFYLSEWLRNPNAPYVQPVRLAAFNVAEAWIFAFLPALWADSERRINKWVLLTTWAVLGIHLTNAFLTPYLLITELKPASLDDTSSNHTMPCKNRLVSVAFAAVSTCVVFFAAYQCLTTATAADWNEMATLIQTDRTYLAFVVDLFLFSIFQPIILKRLRKEGSFGARTRDAIPYVGLIAWLLEEDDNDSEKN